MCSDADGLRDDLRTAKQDIDDLQSQVRLLREVVEHLLAAVLGPRPCTSGTLAQLRQDLAYLPRRI